MQLITIYSTFADLESATFVSKKLIEERLVACYNLFPINSGYMWEGKIVDDNEIAVFYKTLESTWEAVKARLEAIHPYEVPLIAKNNIESNKAYLDWVASCVD